MMLFLYSLTHSLRHLLGTFSLPSMALGAANAEMHTHSSWAQEAYVLMRGSNVGTQTILPRGNKQGAKCCGCPNKRRSHLGQAAGAGFLGGGEGRENNAYLQGQVVRNQLERQLHGAEWEGMQLAVLGGDSERLWCQGSRASQGKPWWKEGLATPCPTPSLLPGLLPCVGAIGLALCL